MLRPTPPIGDGVESIFGVSPTAWIRDNAGLNDDIITVDEHGYKHRKVHTPTPGTDTCHCDGVCGTISIVVGSCIRVLVMSPIVSILTASCALLLFIRWMPQRCIEFATALWYADLRRWTKVLLMLLFPILGTLWLVASIPGVTLYYLILPTLHALRLAQCMVHPRPYNHAGRRYIFPEVILIQHALHSMIVGHRRFHTDRHFDMAIYLISSCCKQKPSESKQASIA